jgi:hypothetical protein
LVSFHSSLVSNAHKKNGVRIYTKYVSERGEHRKWPPSSISFCCAASCHLVCHIHRSLYSFCSFLLTVTSFRVHSIKCDLSDLSRTTVETRVTGDLCDFASVKAHRARPLVVLSFSAMCFPFVLRVLTSVSWNLVHRSCERSATFLRWFHESPDNFCWTLSFSELMSCQNAPSCQLHAEA